MPIKEIHASVVIKVKYEEGKHEPNTRSVLDFLEFTLIGERFGNNDREIAEIDFVETGSDPVI